MFINSSILNFLPSPGVEGACMFQERNFTDLLMIEEFETFVTVLMLLLFVMSTV